MPRIDIGAVLADKAPRLARWIPGFVIGWLRRTIHESEMREPSPSSAAIFVALMI